MFQRNKKTVEETMDIMSVKEASERWNISERWIQKLCEEGQIEGVQRFSRSWMIPKEAQKPADLRKKQKRKE
jgi:excisionase family DNA binding protein